MVHGLDFVRQPGGDYRAQPVEHFADIAPASAPLFIIAQLVGAAAAAGLFGWLLKERREP